MQKLAQGAELQLGNVREIRKLIGQTLKGYQHRLLMWLLCEWLLWNGVPLQKRQSANALIKN